MPIELSPGEKALKYDISPKTPPPNNLVHGESPDLPIDVHDISVSPEPVDSIDKIPHEALIKAAEEFLEKNPEIASKASNEKADILVGTTRKKKALLVIGFGIAALTTTVVGVYFLVRKKGKKLSNETVIDKGG